VPDRFRGGLCLRPASAPSGSVINLATESARASNDLLQAGEMDDGGGEHGARATIIAIAAITAEVSERAPGRDTLDVGIQYLDCFVAASLRRVQLQIGRQCAPTARVRSTREPAARATPGLGRDSDVSATHLVAYIQTTWIKRSHSHGSVLITLPLGS
jgi:hypothetical protein